MTSFAWNYDEQPELNNPSLNSPIPCIWGANCYYANCCRFVHPGEEGTARKLFPSRSYIDNGVQVWEPPTVRLIGHARFYERRRLRLSWPQWCKRVGLSVPSEDIDKILAEAKVKVHTNIYNVVKDALEGGGYQALVENNLWCIQITPEKITGMILEAIPSTQELVNLLQNEREILELIMDACEVLYDATPTPAPTPIIPSPLYCSWGDVC